MTDEELLAAFREELSKFQDTYIQLMQNAKTVEELNQLAKEWRGILKEINQAIFPKK